MDRHLWQYRTGGTTLEIDYLVSTMNQTDYTVVNNMNIGEQKYTVINQVTRDDITPPDNRHTPESTFINVRDQGLSKSRNMALQHSRGDICVICDDDMEYTLSAAEISEYYERYPQADIIIFKVNGTNKRYWENPTELNFLKTMKAMSVEITFRRDSIIHHGIAFDEEFGAGAQYFLGEENIFLWDCLRKNLKILFVPAYLGTLHDDRPSSWFTGYTTQYFISKGAVFFRMSKWLYVPLMLQFAVRKHKEYHHAVHFFQAITHMIKGRKQLLKDS